MAQRIRQVWDAIGSFFTPQPGICVQCHQAVGPTGITAHLPQEGTDLEFCSQHCGHEYWEDYKRYCQRTGGHRVCGLPGCSKPCYREGYKVHDYCGRTHAKEHKSMMEAAESDRRKQHYGGWGSGGGFSSGTSSSYTRNGPIKFYNRGEPYYEFTNFYEAVVVIDGTHWPTTEHYFQAQKFVGTPILETIHMLSGPHEAFDMSHDPRYSRWRRSDWEQVKEDVMYKALQAKFSQHKHLRQMLLDTGERLLIQHSPHDSYWGDGGDGTGKNRLGCLLMKLRASGIRAPSQHPQQDSPIGTGYVSSSSAPHGTFVLVQQQQPGPMVTPGSQFLLQQPGLAQPQGSLSSQHQQPSLAQGSVNTQGSVPCLPAGQPLSKAATSSSTATMTGMPQPLQQHTSMGAGLLGQNQTPPPGYQPGGIYLSSTTPTNPAHT